MRHVMILLAVLLTGCTTEIVNEFHGEVVNRRNDGQREAINGEISSYCSGPSSVGGSYAGFAMPVPYASVFVFYPGPFPVPRLVTNNPPAKAEVWLVRDVNFFKASHFGGDPEALRRMGGEPLYGPVAFRWNDNADFDIRVDASAHPGDATALRGKFSGHTTLKFTPSALLMFPAMLFGEGVRPPAPQPVPLSEVNTNQPVTP